MAVSAPAATSAADTPSRPAVWGAALFGALGVILAFPTVGWGVPVLAAWVPLLLLAPRLTWRQRLRAGWVMGVAYNMVLFRWIAFTAEVMSGLPSVVGWALVLVFSLWHGLMSGVFLALAEPVAAAAERRLRGAGPVAVALTFVAVEQAWPMLFPWVLGHAFWTVPQVVSAVALAGTPILSLGVLALSAGAVAWHRDGFRTAAPALVLALLVAAGGLGWWAHVHAVEPDRTLRVAVVQPNFSLEDKRGADHPTRVRYFERLKAQLATFRDGGYGDPELIVMSEGTYPFRWDLGVDSKPRTGKRPYPTAWTQAWQDVVRESLGTHVLVGGLRVPPKSEREDTRVRNSAVHFGPDGRLLGHYDKMLLIPFGERMPLSETFPALREAIPGVTDFGNGDEPCAFDVDGLKVGCGICYEGIFPDLTRDGIGEARLLANLTIDTWFGLSTAPWFHLMGQASRAAELGVPLARGALTGVSAIVDADGAVLDTLPLNEPGILHRELPLRPLSPPYRSAGPWLTWLAWGLVLGGAALAWRDRREGHGLG